jgi:hypothetical protein
LVPFSVASRIEGGDKSEAGKIFLLLFILYIYISDCIPLQALTALFALKAIG